MAEKRPRSGPFPEFVVPVPAKAEVSANTSDLVRFLLARIEDDAARAKQYNRATANRKTPAPVLFSPERIRAECEAKRQVIGTLQQQLVLRDQPFERAIRNQAIYMLRAMATPYSDHNAYRKEWALSAAL